MKFNESKGITLIALVITIIVLLILAGVSISAIVGENGIAQKAQEAKEQTKLAKQEEERELLIAEAALNTENSEYTDENGRTATISAGLAVMTPEADPKMEENTIEKGLVAIDGNGNEWVWIEVPKSIYTDETYNTTGKTITENDTAAIEAVLKNYTSDYTPQGEDYIGDEWYAWLDADGDGRDSNDICYFADSENLTEDIKQLNTGNGLTYYEYYELKNTMLSSVFENGGFWIGRYETGDATLTSEIKSGKTNKGRRAEAEYYDNEAVIQKNQIPFNLVDIIDAQEIASTFSTYSDSTTSVMFGIQWDLVCKFIEENSSLNVEDINQDSIDWGNYHNSSYSVTSGFISTWEANYWYDYKTTYSPSYGTTSTGDYTHKDSDQDTPILTTTGAIEKHSVLNIYDFSGNISEFTLSIVNGTYRNTVLRGGEYYHGYNEDVNYASVYTIGGTSLFTQGFRVTMY